jgi:hypothetical protein
MRKLLFNYSFYSHPEIGKFQGVTATAGTAKYGGAQGQCSGVRIAECRNAAASADMDGVPSGGAEAIRRVSERGGGGRWDGSPLHAAAHSL